jgi:2-polyprenyl-3-methyl-5-hydroxy-6-metoxy-1,4-benzoquinol methylase
MIQEHGIKSILDIGCGRGISTSWFHMHGVDAQCVEGSHDGVMQSFLPQSKVTEHDFSRG